MKFEQPRIGPDAPEGESGLPEGRIRQERESDVEQLAILNDLIGRLDGMYVDIRKVTADRPGWLTDTRDACIQLCLAAQTILEERRDEIRPVTSKTSEDYRNEIRQFMARAETALKASGDRGVIDGTADELPE